MFDRDNDPAYLQSRLEVFIHRWHGHRKPWYGIAAEKLALTELPQPLVWLYGFAGEWSGKYYWDTLLGNQDCLLPFEDLFTLNGKLVFINENQGVWQIATERTGTNPPVWVAIDGGPWQILDESLMQFLVTFVLHETVFGCMHVEGGNGVIDQLENSGMHVAPIWLNHPYPHCFDESSTRLVTFHLANGRYLIMDDYWCATNTDCPWKTLPTLFTSKDQQTQTIKIDPYAPIPEHIKMPSYLRRSNLQNLIRKHETEVAFHQERCRLYRKMLADLDNEPITDN